MSQAQPSIREQVQKLLQQGKKPDQIARTVGLSRKRVQQIAADVGIPLSRPVAKVDHVYELPRTISFVCSKGHNIKPGGPNRSVQYDGQGYPFIQCRQCNKDRAKRWRAQRAG